MRSTVVLGVVLTAAPLEELAAELEEWVAERRRGYVCLANVHVVETARRDPALAAALAAARLVLADGAQVAWAARTPRVAGADLFEELCRRSVGRGYRHYFLGGTPETLGRLLERTASAHPGLVVAGGSSPPFEPLERLDLDRIAAKVNAAAPDVVWVGLGAPKQELFMSAIRSRLEAPVLAGIGAVFDFAAGTKRRAPAWMQRCGLEWAHRLVREPRRLGRRYLTTNASFLLGMVPRQRHHARSAGA